MTKRVTIIGGGLAGSEAAHQAVRRGVKALLYEMRPMRRSAAHSTDSLAELVCSNSLKSEGLENASGLLKAEMRALDSLVMRAADETRVPAGKTLAVDRAAFAGYVTKALVSAGVEIIREEVVAVPDERPLVIATGPLTSDAFSEALKGLVGTKSLYFYDAVAPIVEAASIDMSRAFFASRYGKGGDDYINCPLTEAEYGGFYEELVKADTAARRAFEDGSTFEACMPIEAMAARGPRTLLFGPMRPVGLKDPKTGARPFAVVQLRKENREGTLYNMVGFQTRLTYGEQKRVLRLIPALHGAEFARLGKLHRNSFIDSPRLLEATLCMKADPNVLFAGQITGVEGYCESAMSGIIAGINACRLVKGLAPVHPPGDTMTGALLGHITDAAVEELQPMNANMGLLPRLAGKDCRERQVERAIESFRRWMNESLANTW